MRTWDLKAGSPRSFTLAADSRLWPTDYTNDHIWELSLEGGEPPALALQTTFGLRARSLRLFPRFIVGDDAVNDPALFSSPPTVGEFYPNFLLVSFQPFTSVEAVCEYWACESHAVVGRMRLANRGETTRPMRLEWVAQLTPAEDGQRMAALELGAVPVLSGRSENLAPLLFLTGGAQPGSGTYPALCLEIILEAGATRTITWALAALETPEASFELARRAAAAPWEATRARIELLNAAQVELHTGDTEWDAALALAQKAAFGLLLGNSQQLPRLSFVQSRQPDHGYSMRGDGSDYGHLWSGQTPLEAYYLTNLLLPAAPAIAQGLLENFLTSQGEDGFVDWKPGLNGRRSQLLATPLLASLAWRIYQFTQDDAFLAQVFPRLLRLIQCWFSERQDRDNDGVPEWTHPMQTGFEDHPLFAHWQPWSQGADITQAESPELCAFLYHECQTLAAIAHLLGNEETVCALEALAENQKIAVETSWNAERACYQYWDRESHLTSPGVLLGERVGPGEIIIHHEFTEPARLIITVGVIGDATRSVSVFLHGNSSAGSHRIERITPDRFRWHQHTGRATSERVFTTLERVELQGIGENEKATIQAVDYSSQDHTLLLPLWAEIPAAERAAELVQKTILSPEKYWQPFGIPACPGKTDARDPTCASVHLPFNAMIAEGLLAYGYRQEAATLFTRLMQAIVGSLKKDGAFRKHYQADSGQGGGERNAVQGLAPVGLFLDILGVKLISPRKVELTGNNPFPWPVTVKYRGLTVLRQLAKTTVIFPDGQTAIVEDPETQLVMLAAESP
jgi:hypothetical protein